MDIRRYWAKAEEEIEDRQGKLFSFEVWGSSNESLSAARDGALKRLEEIIARVRSGEILNRYAYGDRPLREEIVKEHSFGQGALKIVVTRNTYGCLILNTDRLMFIDIDEPRPAKSLSFFKRLAAMICKPEPVSLLPSPSTLEKIEQLARQNPRWGLRIYKTAAGYRCLLTHELYNPDQEDALQVMRLFDCDPLYVKLCQVQKSFRARLTPKPWRCSCPANRIRYPYQSEKERLQFEKWERRYVKYAEAYASCAFMKALGSTETHPEIAQAIELHDRVSRAQSNLPLA